MFGINVGVKKDVQKPPKKVERYLKGEGEDDLLKMVEDNPDAARYDALGTAGSRTVLNGLKDVPSMLEDPVCSSAVKCVMETAFQTNGRDELFALQSPSKAVKDELDKFHKDMGARSFLLTTGYNVLLWGQLPWKCHYGKDGVLERLSPVPDFTSVTPVIVSGRTVGFVEDGGGFVPSYAYLYPQMEYFKNLGGNQGARFLSVGKAEGTGASDVRNEFSYADSYLSAAAKPWRNVTMIEDALLLNRMDQSNYYRIISVAVGPQIYSKSAIQVLNFYRNLFKKVRRVSWDSAGMASAGNGQNFEVIVPKTNSQDVEIKDVGGNVDVKALEDLEKQYQRLFAALRIQPSMIGFSSDTPSSLGDSAANTWDKRFAKVCKAASVAAYDALRRADWLHLRSMGYAVEPDDWSYATVSQTTQEDAERGESFKAASETLEKMVQTFGQMDLEYDKAYLVKSVLGDSLANYGVDSEKLLSPKREDEGKKIVASGADFRGEELGKDMRILSSAGAFDEKEADSIAAAMAGGKTPITAAERKDAMRPKAVLSAFAVPRDNPVDLDGLADTDGDLAEEALAKFSKAEKEEGSGVPFRFPIVCPREALPLTADDLDRCSQQYVARLGVDAEGRHHVFSKADLAAYVKLHAEGMPDFYAGEILTLNA